MNDFVPFPPPEPTAGLYLMGFRVDPGSEEPQFYTLFLLEGENERPAVSDGRILFFSDPAQGEECLQLCDSEMQQLGPAPTEIELACDIANALHIVNTQVEDIDSILIDTIACLDDLVRAAQLNVPAEYMSVLSALAEHLHEGPSFGTWLEEQGVDRERIEDALIWCVGAITVKSRWI